MERIQEWIKAIHGISIVDYEVTGEFTANVMFSRPLLREQKLQMRGMNIDIRPLWLDTCYELIFVPTPDDEV